MKKYLISVLLGTTCALPVWAEGHDAGDVLIVPRGENTEPESLARNKNEGFAISINGVPMQGNDDRVEDKARRVDEALARMDLQVRFDGLDVTPRLDFEVMDDRETFAAGDRVRVRSVLNYPAFVTRGEVRIIDLAAPGGPTTVAVVPIAPNGAATLAVPAGENLVVTHRVYDSRGRYDETAPRALNSDRRASERDGNEDGRDTAIRRRIPITGGSVTVNGEGLPPNSTVSTLNERVRTDSRGAFVLQRILPPGDYAVGIRAANGADLIRGVRVPESDWFYVGTGDLTFGRRSGDLYGSDTYARGRISGFVDGRRASGTRITASVDTGEEDLEDIFRRLDERDPRSTLRRIDPTDLYPTYGDDSTRVEAAPTSGRFFLRVERDGNFLQWGDTEVSLDGGTYLRNERELYGASGQWQSADQTSFGEPRISLSGYAAQPDQVPQRDVFQATGGTIFFLRRQDIAIGTERITVQVRDGTSGRVLSTETLEYGTDYRINYFQGVVTLNRPLSASVESDGVVISEPGGDQDITLSVQYEYTPLTGDVDTFSLGARAETWVSERLRLGVTGTREETVADTQNALGFDLRYRLSDESYVALDVAQTDGPGFGSSLSSDGGLVFDTEDGADGKGQAVRLEAHATLGDLGFSGEGAVGAYAERRSEGFSTLDYQVTDSTGDETLWGFYANVEASERLTWQAVYDDYTNDAGAHERVGEFSVEIARGSNSTLAFGVEHTDKTRGTDAGRRTDLGLRWTRTLSEENAFYVFAQGTVDRSGLDRNDRIGFGGSVALNEQLRFEGELSVGALGTGAQVLLSHDDGNGSRRYAGYDLTPGRTLSGVSLNGRDRGKFILGGEREVNERVSYFSENSYDVFGSHRSLTNTFGVNYDPSGSSSYTVSLTAGTVRDAINGDFDRTAITLGYRHKTETTNAGARLEFRDDDGVIGATDRDTQTIALSTDYARKYDEERRLRLSFDATTSDTNGLTNDGDYVDLHVGYAFRPIRSDRLNLLASYRFLYDTYGQQVDEFDISGPVQRSHIVSLDTIYEYSERLEFGGKIGARLTDSAASASVPLTENNAVLAIANARWHVVHRWDALFELRALDLQSADQLEAGGLAAVYRHFGDNWKVGVGYNFSEFSDDLADLTLNDRGVFLNLVAKF